MDDVMMKDIRDAAEDVAQFSQAICLGIRRLMDSATPAQKADLVLLAATAELANDRATLINASARGAA